MPELDFDILSPPEGALAALDGEQLASLREQLVERGNSLLPEGEGDISDDDLNTVEQIANLLNTIDTEQAIRAERDQSRQQRLEQARASFHASAPDSPSAGDEESEDVQASVADPSPDDTQDTSLAAESETAEAEVSPDVEAQEGPEESPEAQAPAEPAAADIQVEDPADGQPDPPPEPSVADVSASASVTSSEEKKRNSVTKVLAANSAHTPSPQVPTFAPAEIIAAADVPGFPTGASLQFDDLLAAATARLKRLPSRPSGTPEAPVRSAFGIATVSRGNWGGLTDTNPDFGSQMSQLLKEAGDEKRLPEDLMAAGWCAPSQTLYDMCEPETLEGIIDLPEVQITRGGIRRTLGPDFSEIFTNAGLFAQTEAEAIAGDPKPCFTPPCPDFEEVRLDAVGICLRFGILTNAAYPELVQRWIRGGFTAHQHVVAGRVISEIATLLGSATAFPGTNGVAASVLGAVESTILSQRSARRLSRTATIEVIAPVWLLGAIRADLSYRTGVDYMSITDQMINRFFTERGARVQWVENYQTRNAECTDGYPETVELLIYPAGTFAKGVADVIQLDAVYDSAGLAENTYTGLFFEEGVLTTRTCHGGCRISVPVCVSGQTGAADLSACTLVETIVS